MLKTYPHNKICTTCHAKKEQNPHFLKYLSASAPHPSASQPAIQPSISFHPDVSHCPNWNEFLPSPPKISVFFHPLIPPVAAFTPFSNRFYEFCRHFMVMSLIWRHKYWAPSKISSFCSPYFILICISLLLCHTHFPPDNIIMLHKHHP